MDQPAEARIADDGRLTLTLVDQPKTDDEEGWILDAVINSDGALALEDYRFGSLAWQMFGDPDVELYLRTHQADQQKIILLLVRELLTQRGMTLDTFKGWLERNEIPFEFHRH